MSIDVSKKAVLSKLSLVVSEAVDWADSPFGRVRSSHIWRGGLVPAGNTRPVGRSPSTGGGRSKKSERRNGEDCFVAGPDIRRRLGKIGKLKKGDEIVVKTKHEGTFTYEVTKHWITDEKDRSVIVSHDSAKLTVLTCYPFDALGSPERYIVQADLIGIQK